MRLLATIILSTFFTFAHGQFSNYANNAANVPVYSGQYRYGMNPGYYYYVGADGAWISNWSTQSIIDLSTGYNGALGVGAHSFRMKLTDDFLTTYGLTSLLPDYVHLQAAGCAEITAFVGEPHPSHRWDTAFYSGYDATTKTFRGLYEPTWLNISTNTINPANTYAQYLYNVVTTYGPYVKFWEVVNEPDFTYGAGGWLGDSDPPAAGSWFDHDPTPEDLVNLRVPIEYYIRMLRISWEVIKHLYPSSYICTGGIGNRSFLAALLRNTDNPVDGSVNSQYPLKGGAYFDCLSFHTYPEFSRLLKHWDNTIGGNVYERHSDRAVEGHLLFKHNFDSILRVNGYNGITYPKKVFIVTETGMSRVMDNDNVGGVDIQRNYLMKAHVKTQMDGQIKQTYWYQTGDGLDSTYHWDCFGLFKYFGASLPYAATPAGQGLGMKTESALLYGKTYDGVQTAALSLPITIDGGAFRDSAGNYTYVLWAKTTTDLSESASATYSFPAGTDSLIRYEWDWSQTGITTTIAPSSVSLSAIPSFFTGQVTVPNHPLSTPTIETNVIQLPIKLKQ
jgi:hypothetical protein